MFVGSAETPATSFGFSGTDDLRASVSCSAVQPATSIGSAGSPERLHLVFGPVVDRLLVKCSCWVLVPNRLLFLRIHWHWRTMYYCVLQCCTVCYFSWLGWPRPMASLGFGGSSGPSVVLQC